jgi:arsenate reductase
MKKVLVLCTGNSCRSIIAEALINANLEGVSAKSSGVRASGKVNPNAKKLLEEKGIWRDEYHSKTLDTVIDEEFDLIVTVCDHANETCPMFPRPVPKIHVGFEDPDGKGYEAFEATYKEIEDTLLPKVKDFFGMNHTKEVTKTDNGVKISFKGQIEKNKIFSMVQNCQQGNCECMNPAMKAKIQDMSISGDDGDVELKLVGDITTKEVEDALSKSKVV